MSSEIAEHIMEPSNVVIRLMYRTALVRSLSCMTSHVNIRTLCGTLARHIHVHWASDPTACSLGNMVNTDLIVNLPELLATQIRLSPTSSLARTTEALH